jgi:integrase
MAGRTPKLNWTKCLGQYTTCIRGKRYRLGTDKDEAEREFEYLIRQDGRAEERPDPNPTFAAVADRWLEHVRQSHDPDRFRLCKARLEEFVRFVGVGTRVRELRPAHVDQWLASKPKASKPGTQRLYKAMILAPLNWAARPKETGGGGLIPRNPLKGQVKLPEGESRGGEALWTEQVYKQVLQHANPAFADVVRILRWTGCRPNLVCKVEARHYNPVTKTWDVADLYRGNSRKKVKRVWLSPQAQEMVLKLNALRPEGPIFLNGYGKPWNPDALQIYLYNMMTKFKETKGLEWPRGLCVYGLRHTFATDFIRQHPDKLEYLRELLGHKDLEMIRRHYGHLFDEHGALHGVLGRLELPD